MHTPEVTLTTCSICSNVNPNDLHQCTDCGDHICGSCPASACSCPESGLIGELRRELRAAYIELAGLQTEANFMGADSLTTTQQSRLRLLCDIVGSLKNEVNRLDEERNGEFYNDDVDPWYAG